MQMMGEKVEGVDGCRFHFTCCMYSVEYRRAVAPGRAWCKEELALAQVLAWGPLFVELKLQQQAVTAGLVTLPVPTIGRLPGDTISGSFYNQRSAGNPTLHLVQTHSCQDRIPILHFGNFPQPAVTTTTTNQTCTSEPDATRPPHFSVSIPIRNAQDKSLHPRLAFQSFAWPPALRAQS